MDHSEALKKVIRLLSRRDYSRAELRQKLLTDCDESTIEAVLNEAEAKRWLSADHEISERAAESLVRKHKSAADIEARLRRRGLVPPESTNETEVEKIRALVQKKFGSGKLDGDSKAKAMGFLARRGFEEYLIEKVLNEEL